MFRRHASFERQVVEGGSGDLPNLNIKLVDISSASTGRGRESLKGLKT